MWRCDHADRRCGTMFTCLALQSRNRISSLLAVNSRRRIGRIRTCLFGVGHCGGKWLNLFHQLVHTILNLLPARLDDTSSGESTRVRFLGLLNRYDVPAPVSFPFFPFDSCLACLNLDHVFQRSKIRNRTNARILFFYEHEKDTGKRKDTKSQL